jgi:hypothetical protein
MVKIFLESKEEKLYEITIDDFIKNNKKFVNGKLSKSEALSHLKTNFDMIHEGLPTNELKTVILESQPGGDKGNYKVDYAGIDILQEFIVYFSEKLNDVLCNKVLNTKYIRATGNPAYCDISVLGFKKLPNDKLIIKSFIFATVPKEDELYVATTCGSGGTSMLFENLKDVIASKSFFEPENNKIKYIHLDSIEKANTINFYTKIGFYKNNKDTKSILKDMINNVYKKDLLYDEYIRKSNLDIGGSMFWSKDSKVLKKLKCSILYTPELWYKNINKMKKDKIPKSEVLNHFYSKYEELKGAGIPEEYSDNRRDKRDGYELHAVVVNKNIGLEGAIKESKHFINNDRNFYRETKSSYRFRNIPKQKFQKKSFRSKKINPEVTLIYGKLTQ